MTSAPPGLEGLGACEGCLLRASGCREPERYVAITAKAPAELEGSPAAGGACGLCLGLLERGAAFREQLLRRLKDAAGGDSYELGVELPALAVFRHFLLLAHLRGDVESGEPDCVDLKQALRWVFGAELDAAIHGDRAAGGEPVLEGVLQAQATCSCAAPAAALERLSAGGAGAKRRRTDGGSVPTGVIQEALGGLDRRAALAVVGGESLEEHLRRVGADELASIRFELKSPSLYVRGRYLKLSRTVPQSAWIVGGERKGESSVEELICNAMVTCFGASGCSFHGEGREDMDVRMLGGGRPFVVEAQNPRRAAACEELEAAVNAAAKGRVAVRRMRPCAAGDMARLQKDAEEHRKRYVCVCWAQRPLTQQDLAVLNAKGEFEVDQKTPVRVLHRRSLAARPRTIYSMEAQPINAHYFRLRLAAQAGTYIKEFAHGDFGRTVPSLRSLLDSRVEILQLDVEGLDDSEAEAEAQPTQAGNVSETGSALA